MLYNLVYDWMLAQTLWFTFQASLSNCSSELILFSQNRKINWKSTSLNFECHIVCSCNINQFLSLLLCIKTKLLKGKNLNCTRSLLDIFLKGRLKFLMCTHWIENLSNVLKNWSRPLLVLHWLIKLIDLREHAIVLSKEPLVY